jgi:hypothetical protein
MTRNASILRPTGRAVAVATVLVASVAFGVTGCASETSRSSRLNSTRFRSDAEASLRMVFSVPGSTWSSANSNSEPANAECTRDGDPHGGRHSHWNAAGSAPEAPKAYIDSVVKTLQDDARTVTITSAKAGAYGTLYQAIAEDDGRPTIAVTANPRTTTITVDSPCLPAS